MSSMRLLLLQLLGRKYSFLFMCLVVSVAAALVFTVSSVSSSLREGLLQQAGTYEIVVGAEGSATQLVLSSVMRLDVPNGNIDRETYERLTDDPRVLKAVPLALGDSYMGLAIVGTTQQYFTPHREGLPERFALREGEWFAEAGDVVLGAEAAARTGLSVGDEFHGNHGVGDAHGETHEDEYHVVGILDAVGSADDLSLFTPLESVWEAHGEEAEHGDITAILLKPEQLGFAPALREELNSMPGVQAEYPVRVFRELLSMFRLGERAAQLIGGVSVLLSALAVAFAVLSTNAQRRSEMALLRALGMNRAAVLRNLLLETALLAGCGSAAGFALSAAVFAFARRYALSAWGVALPPVAPDAATAIAFVGGLWLLIALCVSPLLGLYRRDAQHGLQHIHS